MKILGSKVQTPALNFIAASQAKGEGAETGGLREEAPCSVDGEGRLGEHRRCWCVWRTARRPVGGPEKGEGRDGGRGRFGSGHRGGGSHDH